MIKGIHHVQITVPKGAEPQAKSFYCGVLGLPEVDKPDSLKGRGGFWIKVGDRDVHIGTEDGFDRLKTKAHVAYEVTDVSVWREKLRAAGFEPLDSVPIEGFDRFEARDPSGNRIEFIQRVL
ncbi:MAG: VOC family protein [Planctomycetota bacterium]|nr:VOC family protein [Planctomycetota bacterium]